MREDVLIPLVQYDKWQAGRDSINTETPNGDALHFNYVLGSAIRGA
jgi:hypothetical protein